MHTADSAQFRTRARAVEMLGRQQIAGIPTAISELFKNAYDAYAHHTEVDFYRSDGLFVLRDDGIGMTRADFETRWLTLGTESKLPSSVGIGRPRVPEGEPVRPVLGEKGIGRLAIAAIGEMLLVLTRSRFPESNDEIVAAFLHWGTFALPGIDLDRIRIPVRSFPTDKLPDQEAVSEMTEAFASHLGAMAAETDSGQVLRIIDAVSRFRIDPRAIDDFLGAPTLRGRGRSGSHFFVAPADEMMFAALDESDLGRTSNLQRTLLGFTNTMTPEHAPPPIRTAFRDHTSDLTFDDILEEDEFFTVEEFLNADHRITGRFDEYGQFRGGISIYGELTADHVIPYKAMGEPLACGPFSIDVAVVQGAERDSALPSQRWAQLTQKMNRLGGLYIYKDGIRVLPYGNTDYDFLGIEKRRTLQATYYYFSFRRMMGAVELDRLHNANLQEKAGREGFRENQAYRQFRGVLTNFFIQLAADFFRDDARSDAYSRGRLEMVRRHRAAQQREKRVRVRRARFEEQLKAALSALDGEDALLETRTLIETLERGFNAAASLKHRADIERALLGAEAEAQRNLRLLRDKYRVVAPRGVGLSKVLRREFDSYQLQYERFTSGTLSDAAIEIERLLNEATQRAHVELERRVRFYGSIDELARTSRSITAQESRQAVSASSDLGDRVDAMSREAAATVEQTVREVLSAAQSMDVAALADEDFVGERTRLEQQLETVVENQRTLLSVVVEQIQAIRFAPDVVGDVLTEADETEALEEELIALRERADADIELAQVGMSVQIINHEFEASIRAVRRSLRELKAWADTNRNIKPVYDGIRTSFDHLDGYLTLFTPLQRRLYRKPIAMKGGEISKYVEDLFSERLRRHAVIIESTARYRSHVIRGYPSTFFPVAVNLIDNAIFWLDQRTTERRILFSLHGDDVLISNNGPRIPDPDAEAIFEPGFTRRPGGRGLGLAIARQALRRDGYDLVLHEPPSGMTASFAIVTRS